MIGVDCTVTVLEDDGSIRYDRLDEGDFPKTITVKSHDRHKTLVKVDFGFGELVVAANDLIAAVENATRTSRF